LPQAADILLRFVESNGNVFALATARNSLGESLRILLRPEAQPCLGAAPSPFLVRWNSDNTSRCQWLSLVAHGAIALAFAAAIALHIDSLALSHGARKAARVDLGQFLPLPPRPVRVEARGRGGGGGGDRDPLPASVGQLPRFTLAPPLTPAQVVIQNPNAIVSVEPTLLGLPDLKLPQPDAPNHGDPLGTVRNNSSGPGSGGGIGTGSDGGVGPGHGPGFGPGGEGGFGGDNYRPGTNGVGYPQCSYCPNPPYTEEARKTRFQGSILLEVLILGDGRVSQARVLRGAGMGLDESALATVRAWRFRPAMGPGARPVAVVTQVEITFHLF